jgi:hypothetical protein
MQKLLQITLKDQTQTTLEATVKTTTDTFIKVQEFQEAGTPLLLNIQHHQIKSLLEVALCLIYFDDTYFAGVSYRLNGFAFTW